MSLKTKDTAKELLRKRGLKLKGVRQKLRLKQKEIAELISKKLDDRELNALKISRIENGDNKADADIVNAYAELAGTTPAALLSEDSEGYQISEGRSDKDSGQRYNTGSPKDNIIGEAELEAMKDKYIEVLEENRELQKKVDSLKAELELFKSGKPKTQGRGNA